MALTYRSAKGSALTTDELDNNFRHFTGSHTVTGDLTVSGNVTGSFVGDGTGLTGVTGEWDGTHVGDAQITGSLTLSGSLLPNTAFKHDLGSIGKPWRELFISTGSIKFVSTLGASPATASFNVQPNSTGELSLSGVYTGSFEGKYKGNGDLITSLKGVNTLIVTGSNASSILSGTTTMGGDPSAAQPLEGATTIAGGTLTVTSTNSTINSTNTTINSNTSISGSITVSGSVNVNSTSITLLSTCSDSLIINGTITSSCDISSSGTITAEHFLSNDDIVALGDISASGIIQANQFEVDNKLALDTNGSNTGKVFGSASITRVEIGRTGQINRNISLLGPVTASTTISASGNITAPTATLTNLSGGGTKFVTIDDDGVLKNSDGINVNISGSTTITGSLTISGSGTLTNIGPFNNTGNITNTGATTLSGGALSNTGIFNQVGQSNFSGGNTAINSNTTISGSLVVTGSVGTITTKGNIKSAGGFTVDGNNVQVSSQGGLGIGGGRDRLILGTRVFGVAAAQQTLIFDDATFSGTYTFPATSGTIALTSGSVITASALLLQPISRAAATDASHYAINGSRGEIRSQLQGGVAADTGWTVTLANTSIAADSLIVANVIGGFGSIITGSVVSANVISANSASFNFFNTGVAIPDDSVFTASFAIF